MSDLFPVRKGMLQLLAAHLVNPFKLWQVISYTALSS